MARGKQKYRDVVGKKQGFPKKSAKKKPKNPKPRKTYSLFKNEQKKTPKKREFPRQDLQEEPPKRVKVPSESSSSDEEFFENDLTQLRSTFQGNSMGNSIDSESETSEEEMKDEVEEESDFVEEEESQSDEEPELSTEIDDKKDPFLKHLNYDLHETLLEVLQEVPVPYEVTKENWPKLGELFIQIPKCSQFVVEETSRIVGETKYYASPGQVPVKYSSKAKAEELFIKGQIKDNAKKVNSNLLMHKDEVLSSFQAEVFSILNNYQDFYFSERNFDNCEQLRFVYCLHAVNHVLKTRLKVLHHNAKLVKKDEVPEEFRDQGLVRPKVLMIVPFKDAAFKIIKLIIKIVLSEDKGNVMHKTRFEEDYTGNELSLPKKNPKPEDYEKIFTGNTSDDFKIGITVTKKSLKLYANFYSADIIVASPLGLRTVIGAEGEPQRDYDFLSSIELLILDQTEIFLMQNWDHILHVFNHLHLQPKEGHETDFNRVRTWSLNGHAKYYRQTIILSSVALPEINSVFNKKCLNYAGKVKSNNFIEFGCIRQVFVALPHYFHKFQAKSIADSIETRFQFFTEKVLPQFKDSLMKQTVIFVGNYFDFVRLRNYFKREDLSFVQICEYSKDAKVARARDMFFHGDSHFMLYTERYHFFHRIRVKGIRHLVFYQPPNVPNFYYEMCNLMQEGNMNRKLGDQSIMDVNVVYSKYDVLQLSQIVGTERASKMVSSERKVHMLLTESS